MSDQLKTVAMVSTMFALLDKLEDNDGSAESIAQRVRFYQTINGIDFPDDFDQLDLAEQKQRLDKLDEIGLEREHE